MGPTIAAIAGAVRDARGVDLAAMPFTRQAILEAADAAPRRVAAFSDRARHPVAAAPAFS